MFTKNIKAHTELILYELFIIFLILPASDTNAHDIKYSGRGS